MRGYVLLDWAHDEYQSNVRFNANGRLPGGAPVPVMNRSTYLQFLGHARRETRRADEADDLLQTVLLAAVEAGRADMTDTSNRRWLVGALRKRAMFDARSAARRRQREAAVAIIGKESDDNTNLHERESEIVPRAFLDSLPPSLRATALLALTAHTKAEVSYLLNVSDAAIRQRISQIRKRWRKSGGHGVTDFPGLRGSLPFGQIRRALRQAVKYPRAALASHDRDGHLFLVCSQKPIKRQQQGEHSTPCED